MNCLLFKWYTGNSIFLLHHKNLGLDYIFKRNGVYRKRLSQENRRMGWGVQYSIAEKKIVEDFENKYKKCEDVDKIVSERTEC